MKDFFHVRLSQCLWIFVIKIVNIWHKFSPKQIPLIGLKIPKWSKGNKNYEYVLLDISSQDSILSVHQTADWWMSQASWKSTVEWNISSFLPDTELSLPQRTRILIATSWTLTSCKDSVLFLAGCTCRLFSKNNLTVSAISPCSKCSNMSSWSVWKICKVSYVIQSLIKGWCAEATKRVPIHQTHSNLPSPVVLTSSVLPCIPQHTPDHVVNTNVGNDNHVKTYALHCLT